MNTSELSNDMRELIDDKRVGDSSTVVVKNSLLKDAELWCMIGSSQMMIIW